MFLCHPQFDISSDRLPCFSSSLPPPAKKTPPQTKKNSLLFLVCVHKLLYCSQLQSSLESSSSNHFHTPFNFPLPGFPLISSHCFPSNDFLPPLTAGSFAYAFLHQLPPSCISSDGQQLSFDLPLAPLFPFSPHFLTSCQKLTHVYLENKTDQAASLHLSLAQHQSSGCHTKWPQVIEVQIIKSYKATALL